MTLFVYDGNVDESSLIEISGGYYVTQRSSAHGKDPAVCLELLLLLLLLMVSERQQGQAIFGHLLPFIYEF